MIEEHINQQSFNNMLLEVTKDILNQLFGNSLSGSIIHYINRKYFLLDSPSASQAKVISQSLRDILGNSSYSVEKLIIKRLSGKSKKKIAYSKNKSFHDQIIQIKAIIDP
jgi:hypothetical protein